MAKKLSSTPDFDAEAWLADYEARYADYPAKPPADQVEKIIAICNDRGVEAWLDMRYIFCHQSEGGYWAAMNHEGTSWNLHDEDSIHNESNLTADETGARLADLCIAYREKQKEVS